MDLPSNIKGVYRMCLALDIPQDHAFLKSEVKSLLSEYVKNPSDTVLESIKWLTQTIPTYINVFDKLRTDWPKLDQFLRGHTSDVSLSDLFAEGNPTVSRMKSNQDSATIVYIPASVRPGWKYAYFTQSSTSVKTMRNFSTSLSAKSLVDSLQGKNVYCSALNSSGLTLQSNVHVVNV